MRNRTPNPSVSNTQVTGSMFKNIFLGNFNVFALAYFAVFEMISVLF